MHISDMHSVHSTQQKQHTLEAIVSTTTVLGHINVVLKDVPFFNGQNNHKEIRWGLHQRKESITAQSTLTKIWSGLLALETPISKEN